MGRVTPFSNLRDPAERFRQITERQRELDSEMKVLAPLRIQCLDELREAGKTWGQLEQELGLHRNQLAQMGTKRRGEND